ncbi:hypothetical protein [Rivularia sp. PCC 7116]|uniref:NACHT C-terminal helical domain 2-containing protein n=1 Tax=Rivularia sp. PCC 7116 TaxID=373994 RepID=UPI0005C7AAE3|nr:hypothetical protein [Rivularia sp. PCC 7116]
MNSNISASLSGKATTIKVRRILQLKIFSSTTSFEEDANSWKLKWERNFNELSEKLRIMLVKHRNIGHDWQFNKKQEELLYEYYFANELLINCLNSDSDITLKFRSYIEDTLLLAIAEIEQCKVTD